MFHLPSKMEDVFYEKLYQMFAKFSTAEYRSDPLHETTKCCHKKGSSQPST